MYYITNSYKKQKHPVWGVLSLVALVGLLASSPTRKIQTALTLVFINYRFEPTVLVRQIKNTPFGVFYFWWPWSDSNRHSLQNLILSQARLPIPPRGQNTYSNLFRCCLACFNLLYQARTAICFVCWFLCRFFSRTNFLVDGLLDCSHFRCQTRRRF